MEDISESSSIRMEREMSGLDNNNNEDDEDPSSTMFNNEGSNSSFNEIAREVHRMYRDADKLLDSIRNDGNDSTPPSTTEADFGSGGVNSSSKVKQSSSLRQSSSSRSKNGSKSTLETKPTTSSQDDDDDDGNNNNTPPSLDDEEDDDMSEELERLDDISEALRKSLNSEINDGDSPLPPVTSPIKTPEFTAHHHNTFFSHDEPVSPLSTSQDPRDYITTSSSKKTIDEASVLRMVNPPPQLHHQQQQQPTNTSSNNNDIDKTLKDWVTKLVQYVKKSPDGEKNLLLTVTTIWAVVLLLLVHSKFRLLDDEGYVRFFPLQW